MQQPGQSVTHVLNVPEDVVLRYFAEEPRNVRPAIKTQIITAKPRYLLFVSVWVGYDPEERLKSLADVVTRMRVARYVLVQNEEKADVVRVFVPIPDWFQA